ncbi:11450_t:CDS:2 [Acaulospora morrowiae]|uniref:11450_t:CDS:1 n=1 Tax=Acaulospora morrowiae TaxID=94023 RepID=A0A9N9D094_9GLOM|nr:11450_t:CDS:2 [Acaulospora morrowiae]
MIEKPHLNLYIHPCLNAALWYIAKIHYIYGEIPSENHVKRECADGAGYIMDADKFQLVYVEGAKPKAKEDKELADADKISRNLKSMFLSIVKQITDSRRRIPNRIAIFGGQIDNANLPRDFNEMTDFIWYYECIIKWALLAYDMTLKFDEMKNQKRPSRDFYSRNMRLLDDLKIEQGI